MKQYIYILFSVFSLSLSAQSVLTGYQSGSYLLQSSSNPSAFPEANLVVGFPCLSNLSVGLQLPLSLNQILENGSDDSLRFSFPLITSHLIENNLLSTSFRNQLFHVGLKVGAKKNVFVYIGDELVVNAGAQFSKEFISYLSQGNANFINKHMNFNSEKIEVNAYNSFYLGSAMQVNEKFAIGMRVKLLKGIANVNTRKLNVGFYTDSTASPIFATTLNADILVQASGQGASNDTIDFDPLLNNGFALDFGASYQFTDQLNASIALNDLGSITWDEFNNTIYTTDGETEFLFNGLSQSSAGAEDLQAQLEDLTDSLLILMEPHEIKGSYKTKLHPSFYLGVSYDLNEKHHFSGLYHRKKNVDLAINVFSLGYQLQLSRSIELLVSCQRIGIVNALASGFVWSPGALQVHFILDNILVADVFDAKNFFVQMGLSFHFGKKNQAQKK